jgi:hypothetical protein
LYHRPYGINVVESDDGDSVAEAVKSSDLAASGGRLSKMRVWGSYRGGEYYTYGFKVYEGRLRKAAGRLCSLRIISSYVVLQVRVLPPL